MYVVMARRRGEMKDRGLEAAIREGAIDEILRLITLWFDDFVLIIPCNNRNRDGGIAASILSVLSNEGYTELL